MVIDAASFTDITRHLQGISQGLLDGMRKVVALNPNQPAAKRDPQVEWLETVEAFVQVNQEVLSLAELLRALLEANDEIQPSKVALS